MLDLKKKYFSYNKDELKLPEVEAGVLASWECLLKANITLSFPFFFIAFITTGYTYISCSLSFAGLFPNDTI